MISQISTKLSQMSDRKFALTLTAAWIMVLGVYDLSRYYQFKWNASASMPQKLWLTNMDNRKLNRGDYAVFKYHDYRMEDANDYELVIKKIAGIAGDEVIVSTWSQVLDGRLKAQQTKMVYEVNNERYPVFARLSNFKLNPLTSKNIKVPAGCYFLVGQHQPTLDSRYKEFGFLCESQIVGKSYPIF